MPLSFGWFDIVLRIALAILAGFVIGYNREVRGHPAGLRTTLLVCVAATLAMLQTNWLLAHTEGLPSQLVRLDFMRLPLGILSGMGFIGGGAILRRGNLVRGLTTAASLWLTTIIGLCFGGGQIGLGIMGTVIAALLLWGLALFEHRLRREREGTLIVESRADQPDLAVLTSLTAEARFRIRARNIIRQQSDPRRMIQWNLVYWAANEGDDPQSGLIDTISALPGVSKAQWIDGNLEPPA